MVKQIYLSNFVLIKTENMKKNKLFPDLLSLAFSLIFTIGNACAAISPVSTDGTVTFSVLTVSNGATYSPANVLAIWVKDAQGNFIISRKVMANNRKQHLVKWMASSGNNSVNAITGATLPNHQTHTVSWDCRDLNGNLVPDGIYQIWIEYTSRNSAFGGDPGPSAVVSFTKGMDVVSLTLPDETYFKNMVLNYSPVNVGVDENLKATVGFKSFPNPFSDMVHVGFELPKSGFVNISVYDLSGKRIAELVNEDLQQGINAFSWDGALTDSKKASPGIYFLRMVFNGKMFMHKIIRT